jgi:hypothetical protein
MSDLEIHYADEWAALYVDGRLDRVGDTYNTEERAFQLLGVKIVQDDAFMCGQDSRDGVAPTVEVAEAFAAGRDRRVAAAAAKVEEARALLAEANALDPTARTGRL